MRDWLVSILMFLIHDASCLSILALLVLLSDHLMEGEFQSCANFGVFVIQKAR